MDRSGYKGRELTVASLYESMKRQLRLELLAGADGLNRKIKVAETNRPGLALAGYVEYFANRRIQVLGKVEINFLNSLSKRKARERLKPLFVPNIPCIIISRRFPPTQELINMSNEFKVPLLRSPFVTMRIINKITVFLDNWFAPFTHVHGSLLEVSGVGVLITGKSGIGKSESSLSLISRGHRLIADDIVRIHVEDGITLVGSSSEITSHHMELRGLGIINVENLFGVGCIRDRKRIDINIYLEEWDPNREYDRLGMHESKTTILGIEIPYNVIPVRPGRDIALLVEAAALNQRLKWMGRNPAKELNDKILKAMKGKI
ncbi:MAG: HPr(Ser) kinase/phosphatase [Candidatus Aureabacteria bacterium]|nr:HPr(Ser) kinase/phosphatase [Candidatus Auribacterota bacterium]